MIKSKVVTIAELTKDNPTFCLSPLRVFEDCHKCPKWKIAKDKSKLKCNPKVRPQVLKLLAKKKELLHLISEIDELL